jgi:transcriptional regulator with XRE-family HTH domain
MSDISVISKRLREARLTAGMSQKQLGIAAGIDEFSASPRINQYERGKHVPDFLIAERLAAVLKIPTPYLFTRDDELAKLILLYSQLEADAKAQLLETATNITVG